MKATVTGRVLLDKKTKSLTKRAKPGDIAVIDHLDIDRVSAESLIACQVKAVVNAQLSNSGRYPNLGPYLLVKKGIVLLDNVGSQIFEQLREGDEVTLVENKIYKDGQLLAEGELLTVAKIKEKMRLAKETIGQELEKFAVNTLDYLREEKDIIYQELQLPELKTQIKGGHVLVVVRGYDYQEDLKILHSYIKDMKPVLIAVDGGADALLALKLKPHIIVGDMDSITDAALTCGAEIVCHAYEDGRAPGKARLDKLGLSYHLGQLKGTSEDLALLLAYELGAELIVAVGTHNHLIEFLDKGRQGMASTFLVRLKVGDRLVDAKGVNQLYQGRAKISQLLFLIFAALSTISVVLIKTSALRLYLSTLLVKLKLMLGL